MIHSLFFHQESSKRQIERFELQRKSVGLEPQEPARRRQKNKQTKTQIAKTKKVSSKKSYSSCKPKLVFTNVLESHSIICILHLSIFPEYLKNIDSELVFLVLERRLFLDRDSHRSDDKQESCRGILV
jgi:Mg2+/citrate symporter